MADVIIERCTVRVVRHGGWRWGEQPQRVIDAVTRVIPTLVARHLSEQWPDDVEGEIRSSVRIRVPSRLADLAACAGTGPGVPSEPIEAFAEAIGEALTLAMPAPVAVRRCVASREPPPPDEATNVRHWAGTVLRVLLAWRARGQLRTLLDGFTTGALQSWACELFADSHSPPALDRLPSPEQITRAIFAATVDEPAEPRRDERTLSRRRRERMRDRLLAAVEIAAVYDLPPWHPVVVDAISAALPPLPVEGSADAVTSRAPSSPAERTASAPLASALPPATRSVRTEYRECAALPFLLLAPLAQVGWLEAAGAAFAGRDRETQLGALAAALAFKVLSPPERGWRRPEATLTSAAAFAGLAAADDAAIAKLAERAVDSFSPLNAVLTRAVVAGHTAGQPLLVHRPGKGDALILVDCEGQFPIGCAAIASELAEHASSLRDEIFLVAAEAASPALFRELSACEITFVTDARPSRGEPWRMLGQRRGIRFWTNDSEADDERLLALAGRLREDADATGATWRALTEVRPAAPRSPAAFEHSLAAAAAVALGYIAWTLWRKREAAQPQLALERFADFTARVVIDRETVDVRLPLGARHSDLLAHGLLDDVTGVPWFGERTVRFFGG